MIDFSFPVLITGASGGLGTALVEEFLKCGIRNLVCQYRSEASELKEILLKYELDISTRMVKADLTNEQEVETLRKHVETHFGCLWGVINLAGASSNGLSWKLSKNDFDSVFEANLGSTFLTTRAFLPAMREKKVGRIVNISSVVAHLGAPGASHYAAAKAAIEGFTRSVSLEVAGRGITVNCIALGYFDRGLINHVKKEILDQIIEKTPLRRIGRANEIVPLLLYLLSENSGFMTGQVLHLDGGLCL